MCLGHKGETLMNGISVLIKEAPQPLPLCEDTARSWQSDTQKTALTQPSWHPDLGLPASKTEKFLLFIRPLICGILLW